jgi:hypothetical protein
LITRESITFNGKYIVVLGREVSSSGGVGRKTDPGDSTAYQDVIEEFLVAGNHPEWRVGSDLVISFSGEKIRAKVIALAVDVSSSRTKVSVLYRKLADATAEATPRRARKRG